MASLDSFLRSVGATPTSKGEWLFAECWRCSGRNTLYFNVIKMVGNCYRCAKPVFLRDIALEVAHVPLDNLKSFVEDHQADERRQLGFEEAMLQGLLGEQRARDLPSLRDVEWPQGYRPLEEGYSSVTGRKAIAYLTGRGFNIHQLVGLRFGYCAQGPYEGRIIIPFYENGQLVYWQARDFTGSVPASEKIKNPSGERIPQGKSDVLFNYDVVRFLDTIIMTESWGSALATGHQAFAINGKTLSEVQMMKILDMKASTIIVLLDPGAEVQAWKIAYNLYAAGRNALVGALTEGDPAEVNRVKLLDAIRYAHVYSKLSHIQLSLMRLQA